jgi:hypothetical protein
MATLSCGAKVVKYILFVFNFIFWVTGAVLLGVGIWVLSDPNATHYLQIASVDYGLIKSAAICLIAVGGLVFIVGGLGCCGACRENSACLTTFSALLIFLLFIQVIAVIMAAVFHGQILRELSSEMQLTMNEYYSKTNYDSETTSWNFIQIEMKCCGVSNNSVDDWRNTYWWNNTRVNETVPQSCCAQLVNRNNFTHPVAKDPELCYKAASEPNRPDRETLVNTKGCEGSLSEWFLHRIGALIGVTIGVIVVQIVVVVMACVLKSSIKTGSAYEYV